MGVPTEELHEWLSFDVDRARAVVEGFLAEYLEDAGAEGFVVGISGGLDSATAAALAVRAVGPERVTALTLPGPTSSGKDREVGSEVARSIGLELDEVEIGPAAEALADRLGFEPARETFGNLQARLRMAALYARAQHEGRLVLGTGNKSELLTGYFTKHGDGGVDLLPLGDIYKTQERELARSLQLPDSVVERTPTAGLWEGQTDEAELGLAYEDLDVVLAGIERQFEDAKIADAAGVPVDEVQRVRQLVRGSWHKRNPPPVPKLGWRTVGIDWRSPTSQG